MGSVFDIGGYTGYDPELEIDIEHNLTLTREEAPADLLVTSGTERASDAVYACDVLFPSSPSNSVLFEMGGQAVGSFVGIVGSGTIFRARCGEGDAAIDVTSDDGVVLDITDFPKDNQVHNVVWEFRVNPGRVRVWIDGEFKGEENTTGGGGLELVSGLPSWAGGNEGSYIVASTTPIAGGDASAAWTGGTAGASNLRFYTNQLVTSSVLNRTSGIWSLKAAQNASIEVPV